MRTQMLSPLSVVPVSAVFEDLDALMDGFMPYGIATNGETRPYEIDESEDHFLLSMDVPGVKKADLKVEIKGRELSISGERHRANKQTQTIARTFTLPPAISDDKIEVHYEDGVLTLLLPKVQAAKPRTLEVQSGPAPGFFSKLMQSVSEPTKQ